MNKFDIAFDYVIENEGHGVSTDKTDRGGVTKFGISEKFIKSLNDDDDLPFLSNHYDGKFFSFTVCKKNYMLPSEIPSYIVLLDINQAKWIYQKYFWLPIYEKIERQDICNYIFDMHVQHGEHKAFELVQRAINAAQEERLLKVDGILGQKTLEMINHYSSDCGLGISAGELKIGLISSRESLFRCIVAHDKTQEDKLEGWLSRCYRNAKRLKVSRETY